MSKAIKSIFAMILIASMFAITGCERVEPGYVGKKISSSGIGTEIYEPGLVWKNPMTTKIYMIPTRSELRQARVNVIMADYNVPDEETGEETRRIGLGMDFLINIRYRLREDKDIVNSMLRDINLSKVDGNEISLKAIYQKYGRMVVGQTSREILGDYTPEEVLNNLEEINKKLHKRISQQMEDSPLKFSNVSLGPISLPDVITDRINANKSKELEEAEARAQQRIDMLQKQNEIELAEQQAVQERIDAQSMAEQNKILNESITPEVLQLRKLQIRRQEIEMMEKFSQGDNSSIFIPYGAMDNPGAQMRMFQENK